jgi:vesicle coat complex subunit
MRPAIENSLKDLDSYVRKTAVTGCIKLFYLSADTVSNHIKELKKK